MDATRAIMQTLRAISLQQSRLPSPTPRALVNGEGLIVWQADSYTPSSGEPSPSQRSSYAPGRSGGT